MADGRATAAPRDGEPIDVRPVADETGVVELHVGDRPLVRLAARDAEDLALEPDARWCDALATRLETVRRRARLRGAALDLLARRAWGRAELASRLLRHRRLEDAADPEADVTAVLDRLVAGGVLDDRAAAAERAHADARRTPAAASLLARRLAARGFEPDVADEAAVDAAGDERAGALELASRGLRGVARGDRRAVLRVARRLARRGFDEPLVREVLRELGHDLDALESSDEAFDP